MWFVVVTIIINKGRNTLRSTREDPRHTLGVVVQTHLKISTVTEQRVIVMENNIYGNTTLQ